MKSGRPGDMRRQSSSTKPCFLKPGPIQLGKAWRESTLALLPSMQSEAKPNGIIRLSNAQKINSAFDLISCPHTSSEKASFGPPNSVFLPCLRTRSLRKIGRLFFSRYLHQTGASADRKKMSRSFFSDPIFCHSGGPVLLEYRPLPNCLRSLGESRT